MILKPFMKRPSEVLGDQLSVETTTYKDDYNVGITAEGTTDDGYAVDLVIQSISSTEGTTETYLIVNLTEDQDLAAVPAIGKRRKLCLKLWEVTEKRACFFPENLIPFCLWTRKNPLHRWFFTLLAARF